MKSPNQYRGTRKEIRKISGHEDREFLFFVSVVFFCLIFENVQNLKSMVDTVMIGVNVRRI